MIYQVGMLLIMLLVIFEIDSILTNLNVLINLIKKIYEIKE